MRVAAEQSPKRLEGRQKVTGAARYTSDVMLPGQLFAGVLRSPHAHARIRSVDAEAARTMPGVHAVLTPENHSDICWYGEEVPLFAAEARFVGDEIAAVAADSEEAVRDALQALQVDFAVEDAVLDIEQASAKNAPTVHLGADSNRVADPEDYQRGDVEAGFKEATAVVELTCTTPVALHNALEPHGCNAWWDGNDLHLYVSTQGLFAVRDGIAEKLGLAKSRVHVHAEHVGGGFGAKQVDWKQTLIAALLSRQCGRPVRLMLDREAENLAVGNRNSTRQRIRLGAHGDGSLCAIEVEADLNIGAYQVSGEGSPVTGPYQSLYACPNVRTRQTAWYSNCGPAVAFRGPGFVEGHFGLEQAMDELAHRLDMDPFELRERNYTERDQVEDQPYSSPQALRRCYQAVREAFDWSAARSEPADRHLRRGVGMAANIWMVGGATPPGQAEVIMQDDGAVTVLTATQDIGTGTRTVLAQIAADTLGLPLERISVVLGNTATELKAPTSAGSATLPTMGPAVRGASEALKDRLLALAAQRLQTPKDQLELKDGAVRAGAAQGGDSLSLEDLAEAAEPGSLRCSFTFDESAEEVALRTFAAQCVELEINTLTGELTVLRMVCAPDCGRIINRRLADSQVQGGVIQGLGFALTEQRLADARTGQILNANLEDYLIPTVMDVPEITHAAVDLPDEAENSLGVKGLGEPPMIAAAPAIASAIFDAIGVRCTDLPITRARLLAALRRKENA